MTTTSTVTVRVVRPDEREKVRDLLRVAYQRYEADFPPEVYQPYLADLLDLDGGGRPATLVAVTGERILGTARYYPPGGMDVASLPAGWAWVRAGAVQPEARRTGIAAALIAESTRLAIADGAAVLGLHTTKYMTATIGLCARLGFRRAPEWDLDGGVHYGQQAGRVQVLAYRMDLAAPGAE